MAAPEQLHDLSRAFEDALTRSGLHGALRFLNDRTPHRFTGVYRYDGAMLRSVGLFDQYNPVAGPGADAPLAQTFCSLLPRLYGTLAFPEASQDPRVSHIETPVVSYCGVQLRDADGRPIGTLCHFDLKPCEPRISDLHFLEMIAPLLQPAIVGVPTEPP